MVPDLEQWLTDREFLSQLVKQQLLRALQRMKSQADKNRSEREFAVGDFVYLRLQPYVQSSVANKTSQKLSFQYFGPFKILQRFGQVVYKLNLPDDAKIHPVVHVSELKQHVPAMTSVSSDLSSLCSDPAQIMKPYQVLRRRSILSGATVVPQLLIHWSEMPPELATWEDQNKIPKALWLGE
ncbi:uncharacterized protein [Miscanthus floridulus]|uniref:uncharacterized protein n=1 Tax=Miscanthus floridulus TaxID=154761 RepID=UPI003458D0A4